MFKMTSHNIIGRPQYKKGYIVRLLSFFLKSLRNTTMDIDTIRKLIVDNISARQILERQREQLRAQLRLAIQKREIYRNAENCVRQMLGSTAENWDDDGQKNQKANGAVSIPQMENWESQTTNKVFQLHTGRISDAQRKKWSQWCRTCMGRCGCKHWRGQYTNQRPFSGPATFLWK